MEAGNIAEWIAIGIIFIGQIVTWVRNGQEQSSERAVMKKRVDEFEGVIKELSVDIKSASKAVNDQAVHCANISSTVTAKVNNLEKWVSDIAKGGKK